MRIAVIGNSSINGGVAVAADLALAGHDVAFAPWPGEDDILTPILALGGLTLSGETGQAIAGRGGMAPLRAGSDLAAAVSGAALVVLDVAAPDFELRFGELLRHLRPGQIVHFNMHGYWPALRVAPLLQEAGLEDVTISETTAPTHAAAYGDGVVQLQCVRSKVPTAVFPANRTAAAMAVLNQALPMLVATRNVLETGFAGLNMMIHFPLVLVNIGSCDRAEAQGEAVSLYLDGMTRHSSNLVQAQDEERRALCRAFGTPWKSLPTYLCDLYSASGETALDTVATANYYRKLPPYPAAAWQRWMNWDVSHGHVPLVELAELAGVDVPLHRAAIALCSAFLKSDLAGAGVTLKRLGIDGMSLTQVNEYVETGVIGR